MAQRFLWTGPAGLRQGAILAAIVAGTWLGSAQTPVKPAAATRQSQPHKMTTPAKTPAAPAASASKSSTTLPGQATPPPPPPPPIPSPQPPFPNIPAAQLAWSVVIDGHPPTPLLPDTDADRLRHAVGASSSFCGIAGIGVRSREDIVIRNPCSVVLYGTVGLLTLTSEALVGQLQAKKLVFVEGNAASSAHRGGAGRPPRSGIGSSIVPTGREQSVASDSKYAANGRRDPFISPVVSHAGRRFGLQHRQKCLEIGAISLRASCIRKRATLRWSATA